MNKNKLIKYSIYVIILIVSACILAKSILPVPNSILTNVTEIKLDTIVYHVCQNTTVDADIIQIPNVTDVFDQIVTANADKYPNILLFPTYEGSWEDEFAWLTNNFGGVNGIPIMFEVFCPGNPLFQLTTDQISATMEVCNVKWLRFAEVYSRCQDYNLTFPTGYVSTILNFCRNHNLRLFWTEWKPEAFQAIKTYISGFEDIVTVSFSTNSGEWEPDEGFAYLQNSFLHWGGSVQSWYWESRTRNRVEINESESRNMPISLMIEHALLCRNMGAEVVEFEPYWYFFGDIDGKARQRLNRVHHYLNSRAPEPQVGIFYYVWYDASSEESWNPTKIIDQPVLGKYDSSDPAIIEKHLISMEELGIDFVVISWWGIHDVYGTFIDEAARRVFETAQRINSSLKFAVMIEPFENTEDSYDYMGIYNYVYENFAEPYSEIYYNLDGKPLICFFNDENLTNNGDFPQDEKSRFSIISVGQKFYTDWIYTDLNEHDTPAHEPCGQISVTPRFDDSRYRTPSCIVDPNLTEGKYDQQWKKAIRLLREGKIDTIMISSWNEYVERTQIEPHYDGTSNKPPDFLYNKTRDYIIKANYEINVQIHGEDYNNFTLSHLSDLGVTWVRMDYETNITEEMITRLHQAGYKVLAIIDNRTIDSRTSHFSTLEEWNTTLLSIKSEPVYQLIDGWEIWNEPNAIDGAFIDPSDYREMLRCAYGILKNSTEKLIISGGLAPHENYLAYLNETFNDSDINSYYDYFGLHLYGDLTENLNFVDEAKKVTGKGVWITEIGRPSETEDYKEDTQASYLAENILGITLKVERLFVYELYDGSYSKIEKEKHFGLLTTAYEEKQAYFRLKELRLVEDTATKPWYENPITLIIIAIACVLIVLFTRQAYLSRRLKKKKHD